MFTNECRKCGLLNDNDSLTDEGECFSCSDGVPDKIDVEKPIRELMDSVSERLAIRVGELKSKVKEQLLTANKEMKDGGFN